MRRAGDKEQEGKEIRQGGRTREMKEWEAKITPNIGTGQRRRSVAGKQNQGKTSVKMTMTGKGRSGKRVLTEKNIERRK